MHSHSIKHPLWKKTLEACYVFTLYCCVQVCHFVDSLLVIGPLVLFPLQEEFKSMIEDAGFYCVQYYNFTGGVVALHSGFKLWDALRMPSVKYRIGKKSGTEFQASLQNDCTEFSDLRFLAWGFRAPSICSLQNDQWSENIY